MAITPGWKPEPTAQWWARWWPIFGVIALLFALVKWLRLNLDDNSLMAVDGLLLVLIAVATFHPRSTIWQLPTFVAIAFGLLLFAVLTAGAWFLMFLVYLSNTSFRG